jgi:BolA protein
MTVQNKVEMIRQRLEAAFSPQQLEVIDESDQHVGHAGHGGGGRHFAIVISARALNSLSRVEAHRQIYALFDDMIPEQIHALRIKLSDQ